MPVKRTIIYSAGFAMDKHGRGLFTDIAAAIPDARHIFVDYNDTDAFSGVQTVKPIEEQIRMYRSVLVDTARRFPREPIDLVCHSQGCIIAALAQPKSVRNVMFLAPLYTLSVEQVAALCSDHPHVDLDLDGVSRFTHADGTATLVLPDYWTSLPSVTGTIMPAYRAIAQASMLTQITAENDMIAGPPHLIDSARLYTVGQADHNFADASRPELLQQLRSILRIPPSQQTDTAV